MLAIGLIKHLKGCIQNLIKILKLTIFNIKQITIYNWTITIKRLVLADLVLTIAKTTKEATS
jgi:hypothetical protein